MKIFSQPVYNASPANWLYPEGNPEATRRVSIRSAAQTVDSFTVKWSSPAISGDVKPLIGNIINDGKIFQSLRYAPNEIAAMMGGKIIVLDAYGNIRSHSKPLPYARDLSVLIDTNSLKVNNASAAPLIIGIESIEFENIQDSIAIAYLASYDGTADSVAIIHRLALNLRKFSPNIFASVRPVFGKRLFGKLNVFATVNMTIPADSPNYPPYFRGLAQFPIDSINVGFPGPDAGDDTSSRFLVASETGFESPSLTSLNGIDDCLLLPEFTGKGIPDTIVSKITTSSLIPSLLGTNIGGAGISSLFAPVNIEADSSGIRPRIKPYFLNVRDAGSSDSCLILAAEEYKGLDSSSGKAALHLFRQDGTKLTSRSFGNTPPFPGKNNHYWSVAVGNVDGNSSNSSEPYFKNNPGNEILVTYTSRDFAIPENRLCVLRYNSSALIPKPSPPESYLFQFDTIITQQINGWIAAVNDLDGGADGKDEVVLANGSELYVLRLKNYSDKNFLSGVPFDTVYTHKFINQVIHAVEIADIEGDGLNDLIVTTFDSTYIIGLLLPNTLVMLEPVVQQDPPAEYCTGDTVLLKWANLYHGASEVNVKFREFAGGNPVEPAIPVKMLLKNIGDTVSYYCIIDSTISGKEGTFLVESSSNPGRVFDYSAILRLDKPRYIIDEPASKYVYGGTTVSFTGSATCADSIMLEYSFDDSLWTSLSEIPLPEGGIFSIEGTLPCLTISDCSDTSQARNISIQILAKILKYADTAYKASFTLLPKPFPLYFDTARTAASIYKFRWDPALVDADSVYIHISQDFGENFSFISAEPKSSGLYTWYVPLNAPDTLIFRFCSPNSCQSTDTVISGYKPEYLNILAPNPFNPLTETLNFVYVVSEECQVRVRIFDQNNKIAAELVSGITRSPGTAYTEQWDGRLADGSFAPNGMYYLCLEISGGKKEIYPLFIRK